jgi:hypothetical protein
MQQQSAVAVLPPLSVHLGALGSQWHCPHQKTDKSFLSDLSVFLFLLTYQEKLLEASESKEL